MFSVWKIDLYLSPSLSWSPSWSPSPSWTAEEERPLKARDFISRRSNHTLNIHDEWVFPTSILHGRNTSYLNRKPLFKLFGSDINWSSSYIHWIRLHQQHYWLPPPLVAMISWCWWQIGCRVSVNTFLQVILPSYCYNQGSPLSTVSTINSNSP